ncbi:SWIM zinc finger family protein [Laspinema palackyanum]|uniref:SWIM zinc finger family protein n=1 Tax=Laspinema palackyanum TaxID=3231601 RepID=UPI00345DDD12|nr:SWIM zinc finger family protein [Laspinema sp. D2c]
MNLTDLTLEEIREFADSPAIFEQGQDCYDQGTVEQFFMSGKGIKAKVEGETGQYSVEIRTGKSKLTTDCTCAYRGEVCEHIVAVLLYAMLGNPEDEEEYEYEAPMSLAQEITPMIEDILRRLLTGQLSEQEVLQILAQGPQGLKVLPQPGVGQKNNVIPFPNSKKKTVAELKKEIQEFFEGVQAEEEELEVFLNENYSFFDGGEYEFSHLTEVFEQLHHLTLAEQIDVLWYVVTSGNLLFSQTGKVFAESEIAQGLELFADRVMALDLEMPQKEVYLNSVIAVFDWPMFQNEELDLALKDAMATLCSTEEELRYAIATLETIGLERNSREWVMDAYRRLGDEQNFIRLYEENLDSIEEYLILANYWRDMQRDIPKSIAILERWITEHTPTMGDNLEDWADLYAEDCPYTNQLLTDLTQYYYEQGDRPNLYRMFRLWLRIDGLCIELYDKMKSVAIELNCWEDCQRQMHLFARDDAEVLWKIYLKQKNWDAAISLAEEPGCPIPVKQAVAAKVKSSHPEAAIRLYNQLAHHYIQKKTRPNYQTATKYVKLIREVYLSILNSPFQWDDYLYDLRQQYQRYRALQEDLQKL